MLNLQCPCQHSIAMPVHYCIMALYFLKRYENIPWADSTIWLTIIKQWIVLFRKMYSQNKNSNSVCKHIFRTRNSLLIFTINKNFSNYTIIYLFIFKITIIDGLLKEFMEKLPSSVNDKDILRDHYRDFYMHPDIRPHPSLLTAGILIPCEDFYLDLNLFLWVRIIQMHTTEFAE